MYDKSVAGLHRIYSFVSTNEWKSVYDQLDSTAQAEIDMLTQTNGGVPQYSPNDDCPGTNVPRMIVDGYVKAAGTMEVSTIEDGSIFESVPADCHFTSPVVDWINTTYVKVQNGTKVVVRIFFS
jgi:hypothetical protein